jgi:hypothetical protein
VDKEYGGLLKIDKKKDNYENVMGGSDTDNKNNAQDNNAELKVIHIN